MHNIVVSSTSRRVAAFRTATTGALFLDLKLPTLIQLFYAAAGPVLLLMLVHLLLLLSGYCNCRMLCYCVARDAAEADDVAVDAGAAGAAVGEGSCYYFFFWGGGQELGWEWELCTFSPLRPGDPPVCLRAFAGRLLPCLSAVSLTIVRSGPLTIVILC